MHDISASLATPAWRERVFTAKGQNRMAAKKKKTAKKSKAARPAPKKAKGKKAAPAKKTKKAAKPVKTRSQALAEARRKVPRKTKTPRLGRDSAMSSSLSAQIIQAYAAASREMAEWLAAARRAER
jgi:hypothetical protein